jgi:hypothetical protein
MGLVRFFLLRDMMVKSVLLLLILSVLSGLVLSVVSLLHQEVVRMTDYSAVRFGFPCHYIDHISVTIAGPTNRWYFIGENLVTDVNLYFLISLGLWSAALLIRNKWH